MNRDDLELFSAILEEKNLAKAAEQLYLSTSTAGARLRAMEQELGFELFERKKGVRTALPTGKGQAFIPIAQQMLALFQDCDRLRHTKDTPSLTIATVDSFLDYNLTPFYQSLMTNQHFSLDVKCYPADMIDSLVNKKQADIGFALYPASSPHLLVTPVMSDEMVLILPESSHYPQAPVHPKDLNPSLELFVGSKYNSNIGWGPEFMLWHNRFLGTDHTPMLTATSISILTGFLEMKDFFSIVPLTTARGLKRQYPIRILPLDPAPPKRVLYMLTHQSPSRIALDNIAQFKTYLTDYLSTMERENRDAL